jgi:hypothetical protein
MPFSTCRASHVRSEPKLLFESELDSQKLRILRIRDGFDDLGCATAEAKKDLAFHRIMLLRALLLC